MMATPKRDREVTVETHRDGHRRRRVRRPAPRGSGSTPRVRRRRRGGWQQSGLGRAQGRGARRAQGATAATRRCSTTPTSTSCTTRPRTTCTTPSTRPQSPQGKHVVSDKPLAMTAAEAKTLLEQATKAGIVHAVTFNYRGNPLVQQARHAIARGDIGTPHFLVGHYLQDWLLKDTDYSWRLEPDKGGASSALGDIGSHWCDLAQHMSGLRITHVLGDITTVDPEAQEAEGIARGVCRGRRQRRCRDGRRQGRGSRLGAAAVRQRRQGQLFRRSGVRRAQERSRAGDLRVEELGPLAPGAPERIVAAATGTARTKSCRRIRRSSIRRRARYAHLPGGHQEAWADAFCNLMRDIYGFIARRKVGARSSSTGVCHVRRRLSRQLHRRSDSRQCQGRRLDQSGVLRPATTPGDPAAPHRGDKTRPQHGAMSIQPFSPQFMKVGDPDGRAAGADAA